MLNYFKLAFLYTNKFHKGYKIYLQLHLLDLLTIHNILKSIWHHNSNRDWTLLSLLATGTFIHISYHSLEPFFCKHHSNWLITCTFFYLHYQSGSQCSQKLISQLGCLEPCICRYPSQIWINYMILKLPNWKAASPDTNLPTWFCTLHSTHRNET